MFEGLGLRLMRVQGTESLRIVGFRDARVKALTGRNICGYICQNYS